jgi:hypothetical protein
LNTKRKNDLVLRQIFFGLFTHLPANALGAKFAISMRIDAAAAFFTESLVEFLTDRNGPAVRVIEALHISFPEGSFRAP